MADYFDCVFIYCKKNILKTVINPDKRCNKMKTIVRKEHKLLAVWAADCAGHVLKVFDKKNPHDDRPRNAINAVRVWVRGEISMSEVRKFAFAAHAAARDTDDPGARAAARAAGHAAATAHVTDHAKHAAAYALKASANKRREREWQLQHLPKQIKSKIDPES